MVGLRDAAEVAFRLAVLQASDLPPVWEQPILVVLVGTCACAGPVRTECRQTDICLAAALLTDDPSPYRAELSRAQRRQVFADLLAQAVALDPLLAGHAGRAGATLPGAFAETTP